jgi:hypothetical protein
MGARNAEIVDGEGGGRGDRGGADAEPWGADQDRAHELLRALLEKLKEREEGMEGD